MLRRSNRLNASGYYNRDGEPAVSYKEWLNASTGSRRSRRSYASSDNHIDVRRKRIKGQVNMATSQFDRATRQVNMANCQVNRVNGQVNMANSQVNGANCEVNRVKGQVNMANSQVNRVNYKVNRVNSQANMATGNSMGLPISSGLLWMLSLCLGLVFFIFGLCTHSIFLRPGLSVSPGPLIELTVPPMESTVPPMESTVPPFEPTVPPMESTVPPFEPTVPSVKPTVPSIEPNTVLIPCEEMKRGLREMTDELQGLNWKLNYRPPGDTMRNFALESQGARVLEDMSSKTYHKREGCFFFGMPICTMSAKSHNPSIVTEGKPIQVGRCWPFQGERGHLVIALSQPITISHVSVSHASKDMIQDGNITSAPKTFAVYGMKMVEDEGTLLGTFIYDRNIESLQTFKLPDQDEGVFSLVKLQVINNWGNPNYTCIYNFRVHGTEQEQTPHPG